MEENFYQLCNLKDALHERNMLTKKSRMRERSSEALGSAAQAWLLN
jgi:hypothetical protein